MKKFDRLRELLSAQAARLATRAISRILDALPDDVVMATLGPPSLIDTYATIAEKLAAGAAAII